MAGAPKFKVYRSGSYVAACKYPEDAAMLMHAAGDQIRLDHSIPVWEETLEGQPAAESFDHVAEVVHRRSEAYRMLARAALEAYSRVPKPREVIAKLKERGEW